MKKILLMVFLSWFFITLDSTGHDRERGAYLTAKDCKMMSKFYQDAGFTVSNCYKKGE